MKKYNFLLVFMFFLLGVLLVGCGETSTDEKQDSQEKQETKISFALESGIKMNVGEKLALDVTIENGEKSEVSYSVSDSTIASISGTELTALKEGTVTITATLNNQTATVTITIQEEKFAISYELNGGTCANLVESRTKQDTITLPTPTKDGFDFDGWYQNESFTGEKVTALNSTNTSITKLYAKWAQSGYEVHLHLMDEQGEETITTLKSLYTEDLILTTPETSTTNFFSGWFYDDSYLESVTNGKLEKDTVTAKTVELYGTLVNKDAKFKVTYVYNGGSDTYKTRAEVVADFIADYNAVLNKNYKNASSFGTENYQPVNFQTFFAGTLKNGTKVYDKWKWLAEYIYDLSVANLPSTNCNVTGLKSLLTGSFSDSGDNKYGLSYSFRGFLMGKQLRPDSNYQSVDFSIYENANGFWSYLGKSQQGSEKLVAFDPEYTTLYKENYEFDGWYKDQACTIKATQLYGPCKVYAKFFEGTPVTSVTLDNKQNEIVRFETLSLEWTIKPANANVKSVTFTSSNEDVATISADGIITAKAVGKTTITMLSKSESKAQDSFEIEVYAPSYFNVSYDTNSYCNVGETIKLNATYVDRNQKEAKIKWSSSDESIAKVSDGVVTAIKSGYVTIKASADGTTDSFDFGVTVLDSNTSDLIKLIATSNYSNVFTRYELGIGAGVPVYYRDIVGSISKILYNHTLTIDRKYEATQAAISSNHGGVMSSVEFITVHYTGNMSKNADGDANASYFASGGGGTSVHYCTGNDGVFSCLADNLVGFHAGDGTAVKFEWSPTGVKVKATDPERPVFGISKNSKFTLNGEETSISVPTGSTPETTKVTGNTFVSNGVEQNCINDMGLSFKVVNGEYYMGTTYWCYTQIAAGRICNHGGNNNSIGIESAVNPESDLWLTWQMTAQLVANLMIENSLDITRVVGHHFFSAKDCPQPLLENDLEIWYEFIDMVKAEYELMTTYKDYTVTMELLNDPTNVSEVGRVTQENMSKLITYKVTVSKGDAKESITLSSIVTGKFTK